MTGSGEARTLGPRLSRTTARGSRCCAMATSSCASRLHDHDDHVTRGRAKPDPLARARPIEAHRRMPSRRRDPAPRGRVEDAQPALPWILGVRHSPLAIAIWPIMKSIVPDAQGAGVAGEALTQPSPAISMNSLDDPPVDLVRIAATSDGELVPRRFLVGAGSWCFKSSTSTSLAPYVAEDKGGTYGALGIAAGSCSASTWSAG